MEKINAAPDKCFDLRREEMFRCIKIVRPGYSSEENVLDYLKDRVYIMPDGGGYTQSNCP